MERRKVAYLFISIFLILYISLNYSSRPVRIDIPNYIFCSENLASDACKYADKLPSFLMSVMGFSLFSELLNVLFFVCSAIFAYFYFGKKKGNVLNYLFLITIGSYLFEYVTQFYTLSQIFFMGIFPVCLIVILKKPIISPFIIGILLLSHDIPYVFKTEDFMLGYKLSFFKHLAQPAFFILLFLELRRLILKKGNKFDSKYLIIIFLIVSIIIYEMFLTTDATRILIFLIQLLSIPACHALNHYKRYRIPFFAVMIFTKVVMSDWSMI